MKEDFALRNKTGYVDLTQLAFSAVTVLYFALITAINQVKSSILSGAFYAVMFLGVVVYFATKRSFGMGRILLYAAGAVVCGVCNIIFIENLSSVKLLILVLSIFLVVFFTDEAVHENSFRIAFDLNLLVITARILLRGRSAPVFVDSSNNYVSVHLLAPLVIYYSLLDARGKKMPLLPAILSWGLSLLAGGRGGLIACTILVGGLLISRFLADETTRRERVILGLLLFVILVPVMVIILELFTSRFTGLYVVSRFLDKGLDGGGRLDCWTEYIQKTLQSGTRILFGTPLDEVGWVIYYKGNLHNSYLFVHAYLGIGGLIFLLVMLVRAIIYGIRMRKWIYIWCILAFSFRALTDHVFGVNRLSVVILTLILLPDVLRWREVRKKKKESFHANTCSDPGPCRIEGNSQ